MRNIVNVNILHFQQEKASLSVATFRSLVLLVTAVWK